jgi:hypothetical protein
VVRGDGDLHVHKNCIHHFKKLLPSLVNAGTKMRGGLLRLSARTLHQQMFCVQQDYVLVAHWLFVISKIRRIKKAYLSINKREQIRKRLKIWQ